MSDGRGPVGKAAKEEQERLERDRRLTADEARKQDPCIEARRGYETNCARSWVSLNLCAEALIIPHEICNHLSLTDSLSLFCRDFVGRLLQQEESPGRTSKVDVRSGRSEQF